MGENLPLELTATGVTHDGKGVCRYNNMVVFVDGLLENETAVCQIISQRKSYATAKIKRLLHSSAVRLEPDCKIYYECGGCDYRHTTYENELSIKKKRVQSAYKKIAGIDISDIEIYPSDSQLRNKVTLRVFNDKGKIAYGFYQKKSHKCVCVENCLLMSNQMHKLAKAFCEYLDNEKIPVNAIESFAIRENRDKTQASIFITVSRKVDFSTLRVALADTYAVTASYILKNKYSVVFGKDYITDTLCENTFNISPLSFYQINPSQAETAYKLAVELSGCDKDATVLDLCCGIGSITLFLAGKFKKAYGVEIVPKAIENANQNMQINGIENVEFKCGDASSGIEFFENGVVPDLIIADPPRSGLNEKTIDTIIKLAPKKLAYISCDTATQARDVKILCQNGYTLENLKAVDFFKRTAHIETVAILRRQGRVHNMRLNPSVFEMIKRKEKTIELRLYDEKRKKVKSGDKIIFTNVDTGQTLDATVVKMHLFESFDKLYKSLPLLKCGYTAENVNKATGADMEKYYSKEEQKKYGVVGIEICLNE